MSTETDTAPTGITKISANFLPRSVTALDMAAEATGDSKTDVLNRAVQLYAVTVAAKPGQAVTFDFKPGVYRSLVVRDVPARPGFWSRVGSFLGGRW